jgi:hypothetical protein
LESRNCVEHRGHSHACKTDCKQACLLIHHCSMRVHMCYLRGCVVTCALQVIAAPQQATDTQAAAAAADSCVQAARPSMNFVTPQGCSTPTKAANTWHPSSPHTHGILDIKSPQRPDLKPGKTCQAPKRSSAM